MVIIKAIISLTLVDRCLLFSHPIVGDRWQHSATYFGPHPAYKWANTKSDFELISLQFRIPLWCRVHLCCAHSVRWPTAHSEF